MPVLIGGFWPRALGGGTNDGVNEGECDNIVSHEYTHPFIKRYRLTNGSSLVGRVYGELLVLVSACRAIDALQSMWSLWKV